jgi:hypothetical protein
VLTNFTKEIDVAVFIHGGIIIFVSLVGVITIVIDSFVSCAGRGGKRVRVKIKRTHARTHARSLHTSTINADWTTREPRVYLAVS